MPYIQCDDGHIYSRADTSAYVQGCIREEREEARARYEACLNDPTCAGSVWGKAAGALVIGSLVVAALYFLWDSSRKRKLKMYDLE